MYVKIRTSKASDGYRLYEAHEVQWNTVYTNEMGCRAVSSEVIEETFKDDVARTMTDRGEMLCCISFLDHNGTPRHIYTNMEAWVLNNDGKTVDRLN